jgi:hypothetical protein
MLEINCEVCGDTFKIKPIEVGKRFCCSKKCGYARLTKYKFGDNHNINIDGVSRAQNQKNLRMRYRLAVLDKLGNKCCRCGYSDLRALQIDHINGGGKEERRNISNTNSFYAKVVKSYDSKENLYQLLCANCNVIKRIENNEHKK